jgi:hypothetical protein
LILLVSLIMLIDKSPTLSISLLICIAEMIVVNRSNRLLQSKTLWQISSILTSSLSILFSVFFTSCFPGLWKHCLNSFSDLIFSQTSYFIIILLSLPSSVSKCDAILSKDLKV